MPKKTGKPVPAPPPGAAAPAEHYDMVFHCQLAHGSPTRQIRDFTNVKQLYESIAKAFGIETSEILYCTLNTHKVDMTRLLGGQIGLDDFLFAHVKDKNPDNTDNAVEVMINKDGPALGLTISDNGAGYAFIKKIREDSVMARYADQIQVGDHIQAINDESLIKSRHFEVARKLKDIHVGAQFKITVVKPKKAFDAIAPRSQQGVAVGKELKPGEARKTLRMKTGGAAVVEDEIKPEVSKKIDKIDDHLEKHIGIRDNELATTMYHLALQNSGSEELFAGALDVQLADFQFPDEFVLDVFEIANGKK